MSLPGMFALLMRCGIAALPAALRLHLRLHLHLDSHSSPASNGARAAATGPVGCTRQPRRAFHSKRPMLPLI